MKPAETMARTFCAAIVAAGAVIAVAAPAAAHGDGETEVTSNYLTTITSVTPVVGLQARIVDIDGTIELTWTGPGVLTVTGYDDEPYLRLDSSGVSENQRSPATYLNRDRYAAEPVPATADSALEPDWKPIARGRIVRWHDHRTHWMSPRPPQQVRDDPTSAHVILPRWEIALVIDGSRAVIAGSHTWNPPPPTGRWLLGAVAVAAVGTALAWSRWSRAAIAGLAIVGTGAMTLDTIGIASRSLATLPNRMWMFFFPALAGWATFRLSRHVTRRRIEPTPATAAAGIVLALAGGVSRLDAIQRHHIYTTLSATVSRTAVMIALGIGVALTTRFAVALALYRPTIADRPDSLTEDRP